MSEGNSPVEFSLGVPSMEFARLREWAKAADDAGFAFVAVGDNPRHMRDTYVSLTVLAEATSRCRIGTATTNPVNRDVVVVASAVSSVEELAPGRVFLGLGRGRAHQVASLAQLRAHVLALRELWKHGETTIGDRRVTLEWDAKPVPIVVAASGPRVLQLAGEVADGVIVESGVSEEAISFARRNLALGADAAGRDVNEIEVHWYVKSSISHDHDEAVELALAPTAASGAFVLGGDPKGRDVPERFWDQCRELRQRYDMSAHLRTDHDEPNRRLLHDPELRRYLSDRFTITGTPDDWLARIKELQTRGVKRLYLVAIVPDPGALVRLVGQAVIPRL